MLRGSGTSSTDVNPTPKADEELPNRSPVSELPIEVRQDTFHKLSGAFNALPQPNQFLMASEEVARNRASYRHIYDFEQGRSSGTKYYTRFLGMFQCANFVLSKREPLRRHKTVSEAAAFLNH